MKSLVSFEPENDKSNQNQYEDESGKGRLVSDRTVDQVPTGSAKEEDGEWKKRDAKRPVTIAILDAQNDHCKSSRQVISAHDTRCVQYGGNKGSEPPYQGDCNRRLQEQRVERSSGPLVPPTEPLEPAMLSTQ